MHETLVDDRLFLSKHGEHFRRHVVLSGPHYWARGAGSSAENETFGIYSQVFIFSSLQGIHQQHPTHT